MFLLVCVVVAISLIPTPHVGEEHRKSQCSLNLRLIGLAFLQYHKEEKCFPAPVINVRTTGQKYSWRVALLPYIGANGIYAAYHFDEPWNGPSNLQLLPSIPSDYYCPASHVKQGCTSYVMVVDAQDCEQNGCETNAEPKFIRIVEITRINIPWTKPSDIRLDEMSYQINDSARIGISSEHPGGAHVLHSDGTVEFLRDTLAPGLVREKLMVGRSEGKE